MGAGRDTISAMDRGGARPAATTARCAVRVWIADPGAHVPDYVRGLAGGLALAGCEVEVYTAPRLGGAAPPPPPGVVERVAFGRLAVGRGPWGRRTMRFATYPLDLARFVAAASRRAPGVVHLQWSVAPPLDALALRALARADITTAYTAHNVAPHERALWPRRWRGPLHRSCHVVVAHSEATARRLEHEGGAAAERIRVVPMPAPAAPAAGSRRAARGRVLPGRDGTHLVLFLGQVRPYKGVDVLLAAMPRVRSEVPGAHLAVVGRPASPHLARGVAEDVRRLGLGDAVTLRLAHATARDFADWLSAADLVALPYRATDDSAVLGAAQGHGRAVVASGVGGLPEAVGDGGLLVPPEEPAALAAAIVAVLRDDGLRARLEAGARLQAADRTWERSAERMLAVYERAIARAGG